MASQGAPRTEDATFFDPDVFFDAWSQELLPQDNDLESAIKKAFHLKENDDYVYHATASVTLAQVQMAIKFGGKGRLHAWYTDSEGNETHPPQADVEAYTSLFSPSNSTTKALTGFTSNAKKDSIRRRVATHLSDNFHPPTSPSSLALPNKAKNPPPNPYLDTWLWSCKNLEWCGPVTETARTKQSHHILPILYHHFSCIVPTHDGLSLIQQAARIKPGSDKEHKPVIEIGSGNGYWAYMLRRYYGIPVVAVDNELSAWRTTWIGDTIIDDGVQYLKNNNSGKGTVLLLVYPQVSEDFTGKVLRGFQGDAIVVAGTQNTNGFTAFKNELVTDWMSREKKDFERVAQVPLPSFAGKDEACFVFMKKK